MFAILCRRAPPVPTSPIIFAAQQFRSDRNGFLVRLCSSSVCENVSEKKKPSSVSYLINSCGLSSEAAVSASTKLFFTSPEKHDAVLELLRKYGFTNADISSLVSRWPHVLSACPSKTLMPKLDFFRSFGVPLNVLGKCAALQPSMLKRSLVNTLIPMYRLLKTLLRSDERIVSVFRGAPRVFAFGWSGGISAIISALREKGVPEPSIVTLVMYQPSFLLVSKDKLDACVDRAIEMGFDISKSGFVSAIRVFFNMSETNMKRKLEVYTKCGWSETDIRIAFLRHPLCMIISEKKIMANMEFLVNEFGCTPMDVARSPILLTYNLDKRIKPRCLVAGILKKKGLRNMASAAAWCNVSEEKFLEGYILKYKKDIPELLDIYRGKSSPGPLLK